VCGLLLDPRQHGEVDAGAEVFSGAGKEGDTDGRALIDPLEGGTDLLPHRRIEGVRLVGTVELDMGHGAVLVNGERGE